MKLIYIFSRAFRFILNLKDLNRFNRTHALAGILLICRFHVQDFEKVRPKRVFHNSSLIAVLFIESGGCVPGWCFLVKAIEINLAGLKSTNHVRAQFPILSKS